MIKHMLLVATVMVSGLVVSTPRASAGIIIGRVAPVRRVAARAVLPPYPVARRAAVGPMYRPYAYPAYSPAFYGPAFYGPGISVGVY